MMSKKFLVVDDSKIARQKLSEFIKELNFSVIHEAEDGVIAVERFKKIAYDYIIMDLEMPNMKGNEASKLMLEINPNINIILVTSIVDKKELIGALKIGVRKILRKPVNFEMFAQAVKELEIKDKDER